MSRYQYVRFRENHSGLEDALSKKTKLYEGKVKILYQTDKEDEIILKFKDDVPATEGGKKRAVKGKSSVNTEISRHIFQYLDGYNIPNHFLEKISDTELRVKKVDIIGMYIVVHNIASGEFCKRYGLKEGEELKSPVVEFFLKNDELKDPLINEYHAYALEKATSDEIELITKYSIKINAVLRSFFQRRNFMLADFVLEFGRYNGKVLLADEVSLDTCTLWDAETKKKFDLKKLRKTNGGTENIYQQLLKRIVS